MASSTGRHRCATPFERIGLCVITLALLLAVAGCRTLYPERSPSTQTPQGRVEQLDCATRRRLRVLGQVVTRDGAGHLVVTVTWLNTSRRTYTANVRITFYNAEGKPEHPPARWDIQRFPAKSKAPVEWTSATPAARTYLIELKKSSFFVF